MRTRRLPSRLVQLVHIIEKATTLKEWPNAARSEYLVQLVGAYSRMSASQKKAFETDIDELRRGDQSRGAISKFFDRTTGRLPTASLGDELLAVITSRSEHEVNCAATEALRFTRDLTSRPFDATGLHSGFSNLTPLARRLFLNCVDQVAREVVQQ